MYLDRVPALRLSLAFVGEGVLGSDFVCCEGGIEEGEEGQERGGEAHVGGDRGEEWEGERFLDGVG